MSSNISRFEISLITKDCIKVKMASRSYRYLGLYGAVIRSGNDTIVSICPRYRCNGGYYSTLILMMSMSQFPYTNEGDTFYLGSVTPCRYNKTFTNPNQTRKRLGRDRGIYST